jgi:hypothetical protein
MRALSALLISIAISSATAYACGGVPEVKKVMCQCGAIAYPTLCVGVDGECSYAFGNDVPCGSNCIIISGSAGCAARGRTQSDLTSDIVAGFKSSNKAAGCGSRQEFEKWLAKTSSVTTARR